MASIEEQFSNAARQHELDHASGRISASVILDISKQLDAEYSADDYLRAPRLIVEIATRFDDRHAQMRLLAAKNGQATEKPSPYGQMAQEQLLTAVYCVLDDIGELLAWKKPQVADAVDQLIKFAKTDIERLVRRRYGERDLQHRLELDGARVKYEQSMPSRAPVKGAKKIPIDDILRARERKLIDQLRMDSPTERELQDQLVNQLYSLSSADLLPLVNEERAGRGLKAVTERTIRRSSIYEKWERHRRALSLPFGVADCGLGFAGDRRTPSKSDLAAADLKESHLTERWGRKGAPRRRRKSSPDDVADQWAASQGVTLPPTN